MPCFGKRNVLVNETVLKIGVGTRVLLTGNSDISDRLIMGECVKYCTLM